MDTFSITAALRQLPQQNAHRKNAEKAEVATFWIQREQKYSHHEHYGQCVISGSRRSEHEIFRDFSQRRWSV
jgi:hypothetical protein